MVDLLIPFLEVMMNNKTLNKTKQHHISLERFTTSEERKMMMTSSMMKRCLSSSCNCLQEDKQGTTLKRRINYRTIWQVNKSKMSLMINSQCNNTKDLHKWDNRKRLSIKSMRFKNNLLEIMKYAELMVLNRSNTLIIRNSRS